MRKSSWNLGTYDGRCWGYDPYDIHDPNRYRRKRYFAAYWWFVGWTVIVNMGFHIDFGKPNIEIHLPFGFFRIGWEMVHEAIDTGKEVD